MHAHRGAHWWSLPDQLGWFKEGFIYWQHHHYWHAEVELCNISRSLWWESWTFSRRICRDLVTRFIKSWNCLKSSANDYGGGITASSGDVCKNYLFVYSCLLLFKDLIDFRVGRRDGWFQGMRSFVFPVGLSWNLSKLLKVHCPQIQIRPMSNTINHGGREYSIDSPKCWKAVVCCLDFVDVQSSMENNFS